MISKRITQIEGTFMGTKFFVKPVPINLDDIDEKQRQMLLDWYGEHHPTVKEKLESGADLDSFSNEELLGISAWKKDVEFRAEYIKYLAESCMQFEKAIPEENWKRDDLPYSVVKEAWDFFTERRVV